MLSEKSEISQTFRLSVPAYVGGVAVVTVMMFGIMALFRPTLAYPVKEWLGLVQHDQVTADSLYALRVAPLLEEHCVGCHGARRQKAKLQLDSYAHVLRGSRQGPVIKAGDLSQSELVSRITLSASNSKAMPPNGESAITADEVTLIKLWIAAGASSTQREDQIKGVPKPRVQIKFVEIDEAAVLKARAPQAERVKQMQARYPNVIAYESRGSAELHLNASLLGTAFGDADLAKLLPLTDRIVWADLSGTAITDASSTVFAAMTSLRTLRLMNTPITDTTVDALRELKKVHSLTVVGAAVTQQSLIPLRSRGVHVYDGHDIEEASDGKS